MFLAYLVGNPEGYLQKSGLGLTLTETLQTSFVMRIMYLHNRTLPSKTDILVHV